MATKYLSRDVKYLNKDFSSFRGDLIEFAKTYFPNTYNDFNESDPGMMFIEMASYVGDVLSFYIDEQFKETMLPYAEEDKTVYEIAQGYGYKPNLSAPAVVTLDVFQTVPVLGAGEPRPADENYALTIPAGMTATSDNGVTFRTVEDCIFADSSSMSPRQDDIYEVDDENKVSKWLLKKSVKAVSGNVTTEQFTFGAAEKYKRIALSSKKILEIISVIDSDGNKWYEVPFLAQDVVYADFENTARNSPDLSNQRSTTSYLLKLVKTSKRFITFIRSDGRTEMRFGAGVAEGADEEIIPNPSNVGSNLPGTPSFLDTAFDPANFLKTETYGQCPTNTTLTIKYSYGGGVSDNSPSNTITSISSIDYQTDESLTLDGVKLNDVKTSVAVTNPDPATGGKGTETIEEIKTNALAYFQTQGRAVTKDDYVTRLYSLPSKYGNIAKAYIVQDQQISPGSENETDPTFVDNPLALNLYTLGYDQNKKLIGLNQATKENIKVYLSQYRMMTDAINIKDAFIINIKVEFEILSKKGYNKQKVLLRCIDTLKSYFNINKWQINQPIILGDLAYEIALMEGVASIIKDSIVISNASTWEKSQGYSGNMYNINAATIGNTNIVYPAIDPSIFEVKYPNKDIVGNVVGDV